MAVNTCRDKSTRDERGHVPRELLKRMAFVSRAYVDFSPRYSCTKGLTFSEAAGSPLPPIGASNTL